MYFDSFEAFLQMGKHGPYVWSAYGISLLLMVASLVQAVRSHRDAVATIRRQVRRERLAGDNNEEQGNESGS